MKVLMFSTDSSILQASSPAQKRMIEYGSLVERLFIFVLPKKELQVAKTVIVNSKVTARPLWFWKFLYLLKELKAGEYSLVTAQEPFETGFIGWLASRRLKSKLQLQIHTDFLSPYFTNESLKNRIRVWAAKRLLNRASSIRVVSERIKESLKPIVLDMSKVVVLPIFVDVKKIESERVTVDLHKKYPQFDFIMLMASRLTREKNIGLVVKVMSEIVPTNPRTGLIIVGDGPEKEKLILETGNRKLETNIIFEPWTDELFSYYKTADVFLNASNYEGYGRTMIEAAAGGCPIITTDVGVVGELINKDNSLIIPVGDREALKQSILRLASDNNLRHELARKTQNVIQNLGTKDEYLEKYKQSWL